jgi:hypothetical protein
VLKIDKYNNFCYSLLENIRVGHHNNDSNYENQQNIRNSSTMIEWAAMKPAITEMRQRQWH